MNSGRVNAFATQQRLDTTCGGVGPGQPSLGQYATSGFCASENMASGRTDFDFPSDLSLSDLPSTIADAAQSQQEQQQQQQQQAAHQQQCAEFRSFDRSVKVRSLNLMLKKSSEKSKQPFCWL
ncbi:unnamed protein product [Anisakis simplex]|uniref:Uncharacterized protein n=1 Tax=Anisakis simplex TaxID=6269 RepID=A0A0M3JF07_ANISI|nr:unnamed protein product [Anisakis simplex]